MANPKTVCDFDAACASADNCSGDLVYQLLIRDESPLTVCSAAARHIELFMAEDRGNSRDTQLTSVEESG